MTTLNPPSVLVEPGAHTASGDVATLTVHVRNLAAEQVDIHVSIVGLEPSWVPDTFAVPAVGADETVTVTIPLVPIAGATPGDYPFVVAVEALVDGVAVRTLADGAVRVDGDSELVMSIEPVEARAVRSAAVDVVLVNASDQPAEVHLHAAGRDGLEVTVPDRPLLVAPRETVRVGARVRSPRVRLVGSRRRHAYTVTATGRAAPQHVQASLSVRPLVGSGFARVVGAVAVIALWVAGVFTVLPYLADRFSDRSTSVDQVTVEADGDGQGDPDGSGDGSGGGSGGGSGEGDDGGTPGAGADQVRAAGQITGVSPGGVTVAVVPASSLWEATATGEGTEDDGTGLGALGEAIGSTAAALHPVLAGTRLVAQVAALTRAAPTATGGGKMLATALPLAPTDDSTQRMSVRSDDQGAWAIAGLSPSARYLVSVSKPGFQTQRVLRTGAELAAAPLETEMRAGTGQLSGGVTGPDGPVGGVEVTISDGLTTVTTRTATTGNVGHWQVDGLATPGTYLVTAASDRLGAQSRLVTLAPSGVRTVDLRLRPGLAAISGRIVGKDALGQTAGIGGLTVTASNSNVTRSATTATGDEARAGTFVLPDLPVPATYTVTVSGAGYNTVTREVQLGPSGRIDWDISVGTQGGSVTGTVTSTDGPGITGVGLTLTSETETFKTMSASGGKGTFLFSGIPAGTYVLSAQSFGFQSTFAQVEVRDGKETTIDLRLVPVADDGLTSTGSITGRVTDASHGGVVSCIEVFGGGDCLVHARVDFKRLDGTPAVLETWVEPDDPYVLPETDPATGGGLPPGRYTVQLTAPGYEPGSVQVTVGMGIAAEAATVALVPSPSLVGTVIPRVGILPPGTCVVVGLVVDGQATDPTGGANEPCVTAVDQCNTASSRCVGLDAGTYAIDRLSSGTYSVRFMNIDPTYRTPAPYEITLSPGDLRRYDVTIERLGIINLTVLKAEDGGSIVNAGTVDVRATSADGTVWFDLTTTNGFASFTRLEPGTWTLEVTDGSAAALVTQHVGIDLNQEIAAQMVITGDIASFTFEVSWQKVDGVPTPIENAIVRVRGVTRYVGTIPFRETFEFRTDQFGVAQVCTVAIECRAGETPIALVDRIVDITVEKSPDFQSVVWNSVEVPTINAALLRPNGVPFAGLVTIDPVPAASENEPYSGITFQVVKAPPGTGQVSLSVNPVSGVVSISDSAGSGGNRMRPGEWEIRADRAGHTSAVFTIDLEPGTANVAAEWELFRFGRLVVHVFHGAVNIPNAQVILSQGNQELGTRLTAADGTVDFGEFLPGTYQISVRAAGYAERLNLAVALAAGRPAAPAWEVELVQLGSISGLTRTRITSSWYQALGGAEVTATYSENNIPPVNESFSRTTGTTGSYRITGDLDVPGLRAGFWDVTAEAYGHDDAAYVDTGIGGPAVEITPGEQQGGINLDLNPVRSVLTITVFDGEDKISGLDVVMRWRDGNSPEAVYPCRPGVDAECAGVGAGEYRFSGLLPISYNISISGGTFLSVNVPHIVEIASDETLPIALTAPGGSVQGTLYQRTGSGGSVPMAGKVIELEPTVPADPPAPMLTMTTPSSGVFSIVDVPAGEYTLRAREPADPGPPSTPGAVIVSRSVQITSGQATVVDLFVDAELVTAIVNVTSENGTDLTGAQVTLSGTPDDGGGLTTFGPATLLRTAPGSDVFRASFPQLPLGTWTPTVTGPAGHVGSHVGTAVVVSQASSNIAMTVEEREVRLRATAVAGATVVVPVVLTLGSGAGQLTLTRTLQAGASDTVLYVPELSLGAAVPNPPAGWAATVSPPGTVASSGTPVTFVVSLTADPDDALSFCTTGAVILTDFACWVELDLPAGLEESGRAITVEVGSWDTTVTTGANGRANFTVPGTTVGTSSFTLGATWSGDGLTTVPATTSRAVTPSGTVAALTVALCTTNATSGQGFQCSVTLSGPTGFAVSGRQVVVRAARGATEAWTGTVTTTAGGSASFTVPQAAVGTTNFTLSASWTIAGLTTPRTDSRTVTVTAPPGGGGGGGGGG